MLDKEKKLTVGEVAKKLNVTVRTIQYYDQIGLVTPTEFTEGGRRLYSVKDYVKLHQILSLKDFGFSLKEIKEELMPASTVEEMNKYLIKQESLVEEEIKKNQVTYELLHTFRKEMNQLGKVDWEVLLEIIHLLRNQDEHYWIVKYLDKDLYEKIKERTVKEEGHNYIKRMQALCEKAEELQKRGLAPESKEGKDLAKQWWDEIMNFTKGDMEMIRQLTELTEKSRGEKQTEFLKVFRRVEDFISKALSVYFEEDTIELKGEK